MDDISLQRLNLRGTVFTCNYSAVQKILTAIPSESVSSRILNDKCDEYFFDRDPKIFHSVLDFYSRGSFHLPTGLCSVQVREELAFWGIDKRHVQDCCLKILYDDDLDSYNDLKTIQEPCTNNTVSKTQPVDESKEKDWDFLPETKERIWKMCDKPTSCIAGKIWVAITVLNTIISVVVYGLNTTRQFRTPRDPREIPNATLDNDNLMTLYITTENCTACVVLDVVSNTFLFIDLVIRLIVCPRKKQFIFNVGTISEFVAILAVVVILVVDRNPSMQTNEAISHLIVCVGVLYSTRVIRVLRVVGLFKEVRILYLCIRKSSRDLILLIITFLSFSLIFGAAMFWAEVRYTKMFYNYFISVWWAVVTMTTVGYGLHYPSTIPGYIVGSITAVFGLIIIAVPVAILSSNFNTYYNCHQFKKRHTRDERKKKRI